MQLLTRFSAGFREFLVTLINLLILSFSGDFALGIALFLVIHGLLDQRNYPCAKASYGGKISVLKQGVQCRHSSVMTDQKPHE